MKKLKFVVTLIFMSFCFFANAESILIDLTMEKTSQNINVPIDIPEVITVGALLKDQNINFFNFNSDIDIVVKYHSLPGLNPNDLYAGIDNNQFYRLTSTKWVSSDRLYNSVEKYKPPISYQF